MKKKKKKEKEKRKRKRKRKKKKKKEKEKEKRKRKKKKKKKKKKKRKGAPCDLFTSLSRVDCIFNFQSLQILELGRVNLLEEMKEHRPLLKGRQEVTGHIELGGLRNPAMENEKKKNRMKEV